jgi:putative peptidoglycan lipid II flippase
MKKTMFTLMLTGLLIKFLGFLKEVVLASYYGASSISDAYLISLTIPTVIFSFLGVAISTTFIPKFTNIAKNEGDINANRFTSNIINILIIITTILIMIVLVFTEPVVKVFASGFTGETLVLAVRLTRISIFSLYFIALLNVLIPYLQVRNHFIIPSLVGLPLNLTLIISIIMSAYIGVNYLAIGKIVGVFLHKFRVDFSDKNVMGLVFLALPVMLGTSVNQINILVDRTIASQVASGGISILNYANRINLLVSSILVIPITTVLYPNLAKKISENDSIGFINNIQLSFNSVLLLVTPVTIGLTIFSNSIISFVYGRGAFDSYAQSITANALFFYSLGVIGINLREVISRIFYALEDTKTPMINASLGLAINILLNIILSRYIGISGLALATSIAATFTTILLLISLRKKIGPFGMKQISISFLKILFASSLMGGLAKLSFNYLTASLSQNLSLLMAIGVGAVSYFVIIYFMKIEDVDVIVGAIKKKLGRGSA